MQNLLLLTGRIMLAVIFVWAGLGKIGAYEGTQAYMASQGVSVMLLPMVILLEVAGGVAIVVGFFTRAAALALAGFCVISALLFHSKFGDQAQAILFMKNIAIAGGFLLLAASGPGDISIDNRDSRPASD